MPGQTPSEPIGTLSQPPVTRSTWKGTVVGWGLPKPCAWHDTTKGLICSGG